MTTESNKHRDDDAYRLHAAWRTHIDRNIESLEYLNKADFRAAAAEFAAPYLARIAELEAENTRLRSVFVPPGSSLILIAPETASQDKMHDTAKRAADVHDGPVIVMAHDWQSMSADELRTRINGATPPAQKHPKYERSWLSKQTDDKLADLYVDHVGFFDMNGMMLERENMIETLAAIIGDP